MAKVPTSISIDADVKQKAQALFAELGLDLSTAVNIFLRQAVYEHGLPFTVNREVPNGDTIAALEEAESMRTHPERYKRYGSFSELLREVEENA